jgi:hypothetical protein
MFLNYVLSFLISFIALLLNLLIFKTLIDYSIYKYFMVKREFDNKF